jgi:D-tyrosyl-tRNA(Tyr) deacylase
VKSAAVYVDDRCTGKIGVGLLVFVGVWKGDGEKDLSFFSSKLPDLRVFEDAAGKFNLSLKDVGGEMLVVSQFTLYADCSRGRRPSFIDAEDPVRPEQLILKLRGQSPWDRGIPSQDGGTSH